MTQKLRPDLQKKMAGFERDLEAADENWRAIYGNPSAKPQKAVQHDQG